VLVNALRENFDNITYMKNNSDQGLDSYRVNKGRGEDIRLRIEGYNYPICIEVKNFNPNGWYLTPQWFESKHELPFTDNKLGGEIRILVTSAKVSKECKKYLRSKGIILWQLSQQVTIDNQELIKLELHKHIKCLLFLIKNKVVKYNKYNRSTLVNCNIRYIDKLINRIYSIDRINDNRIELNDRLKDRLTDNGVFDGPPFNFRYSIENKPFDRRGLVWKN
jgi:hypothetical protein